MNKSIYIILLLFIFAGCNKKYNEDFAVGKNEKENLAKQQQQQLNNSFTQANRIINLKEKENILSYISRRKWNMEEKDGIYIQINRQGEGRFINDSNTVSIQYDCFLLNGKRYGENKTKQVTFKMQGDTKIPFGLMQVMKYLKKSSQANIIIPSNLSFEISDEGEKISSDNTLIYILKVINVL